MDCGDRRFMDSGRRDGGGPEQARQPRALARRALMISLEVLYGFGGIIAIVLFAYLVFALICAEEF